MACVCFLMQLLVSLFYCLMYLFLTFRRLLTRRAKSTRKGNSLLRGAKMIRAYLFSFTPLRKLVLLRESDHIFKEFLVKEPFLLKENTEYMISNSSTSFSLNNMYKNKKYRALMFSKTCFCKLAGENRFHNCTLYIAFSFLLSSFCCFFFFFQVQSLGSRWKPLCTQPRSSDGWKRC